MVMNESVAKSAIHSSKKQQSQLQQNLISAVDNKDPMAPRNVGRVLPDNTDPMAPKNVGRVLPDGDKTEFVRDNRNPSQMQVHHRFRTSLLATKVKARLIR